MGGIGRFLTALAVMAVLLLGAAGSASAHAVMTDHGAVHNDAPCTDHEDQGTLPCDYPDQEPHHAMPMAAPCCPSLEAPARITVTRVTVMSRIIWHPAAEPLLATLLITPEPPPPRTAA
ncbi:hypothetical protein HUE56_30505 (plasmid) [Azospirillum oryzae]|uniref:CopL family metal-binding regulatory protein n=1 Tax=Azospirillum oryzae TaxID=286727 RepID=A0A6N1AT95_9PROT|nr:MULTISPECIES: hypothetical protein [Azospirillum]KAA0585402.1 hypothetical protein FZ938_25815 [Azospirillum oryzae]QCG99416.1 hypothetical protein E6C67_37275 [Azospirillum sp. TSA2s]QKS54826.1 hypothetical protein HUE56_30505 [Azospirillum oryzae]GLR77418.1 hypothetical protein GCM10007856_00860 [Azospirillum oryzae]